MNALAPLIRELKLRYYEAARKELQQRDPMHPDLPHIVRRIHQLMSERPPIDKRPRSRCEEVRGLCAGDVACPDIHCPGRWRGIHHKDGGMQVEGAVSFPIDPPLPPEPTRIAIALPDLITASCALALVACTPLLPF